MKPKVGDILRKSYRKRSRHYLVMAITPGEGDYYWMKMYQYNVKGDYTRGSATHDLLKGDGSAIGWNKVGHRK